VLQLEFCYAEPGRGAVIFWLSPLGDTRQGGFRAKRETTPQALRYDRGADPALEALITTRDDGEQDPTVAGLDELQPVVTELRSATEQQAADAQTTAPATATQEQDTADTDRDPGSDVEPADEED